MYDVIVIGGGPAGMLAAGTAAGVACRTHTSLRGVDVEQVRAILKAGGAPI